MSCVVCLLTGSPPTSGSISNPRQLSRSVVSAALQLGEQIEGVGVWRALSGSGASLGGGTVGGNVVGEVAAQPASSSVGSDSVSSSAGLCLARLAGDGVEVFTVGAFQFSIALGGFGGRCSCGGSFGCQVSAGPVGRAQSEQMANALPKQQRGQHQGQELPGAGFE